jgi:hypothetical protein
VEDERSGGSAEDLADEMREDATFGFHRVLAGAVDVSLSGDTMT